MANPIVRLSLLLGSPGWYFVISKWVNAQHGMELKYRLYINISCKSVNIDLSSNNVFSCKHA